MAIVYGMMKLMGVRKRDQPTEIAVWIGSDDIIHLLQKGPQNAQSVGEQRRQAEAAVAKQRAAGKRVLLLADLSQVYKTDSGARIEAKKFLNVTFDAFAVVGNKYLQPIVAFVLRSMGMSDRVHYFTNVEAARQWLLNPSAQKNHRGNGLRGFKPSTAMSWAILPILLVLVIATLFTWQQTRLRVEADAKAAFDAELEHAKDAFSESLHSYVDASYGYRGLFHSSEHVEEKEFKDYTSSLDVTSEHSGANAVTFVSAVTNQQKANFLQQIREDNSLADNSSFTITPEGTRDEYFVVTFIAGKGTAPKGFDVATEVARYNALSTARDTGEPTISETLSLFNETGQQTDNTGFLLAMPIYKDKVPETITERRRDHEGFVVTVFDYKKLLTETFERTLSKDIALSFIDGGGAVVYEQGQASERGRTGQVTVEFGGTAWTARLTAPELFGSKTFERALPWAILALGLSVTIFLVAVFWLLNRSRQRALMLAEDMTQDLQQERNQAIATRNKDEAILSSIGDGVFAVDMQGRIIIFNLAAERMSGFSAKYAIGQHYSHVLQFIDQTGREPRDQFILKALRGNMAEMERETRLRTRNGQLLSVADSAAPIFDAEGKQQGVIVVFRDVTEEEAFERALQQSNERFEMVATATNDLIYDLNMIDGNMWWSNALRAHYGYTRLEEASSLEWFTSHVHPEDATRVADELEQLVAKHGKTRESEYRFQKSDGTYAFVRDRAFLMRDAQGNPARLVGSILDVTKQKELERAKDEFISLVSHQLRTPLTAIRLFTEMLVKGQVGNMTAEQKDYLEKVDASTKRMIRLVSDILNVSRVELGRLKIQPEPTDVNALIASHLDEIKPLADAKNTKIFFTPQPNLPKIMVDPILFGQIVHNFCTNAIRYSRPEGGEVHIAFVKDVDGYRLGVKDNGIGIPKEAQSHMFQRFYRADNAKRVEGEGTGLGLYLIKMVVDSAGGAVGFESEEGKGTTFYVTMPLDGMRQKDGDKTLS